jgi:uncharacterized protein (DUF433 family)
MNWETCEAVDRIPGKLGGAWCFRGTRMPVRSLFEHLDRGCTVAEFVEWFPDVRLEQIHQVLAFTEASLEPASVA